MSTETCTDFLSITVPLGLLGKNRANRKHFFNTPHLRVLDGAFGSAPAVDIPIPSLSHADTIVQQGSANVNKVKITNDSGSRSLKHLFPFPLTEAKSGLNVTDSQLAPRKMGIEKMREEGKISDTTKMSRTNEIKLIKEGLFAGSTEQKLNRADDPSVTLTYQHHHHYKRLRGWSQVLRIEVGPAALIRKCWKIQEGSFRRWKGAESFSQSEACRGTFPDKCVGSKKGISSGQTRWYKSCISGSVTT